MVRTLTRVVVWAVPVAALAAALAVPSVGWAAGQKLDWTPDVSCATCHVAEAASLGASAGSAAAGDAKAIDAKAAAGVGALHGSLSCTACHDDEAALKKAHKNVDADSIKGAKRLRRTEVQETVCLTCHESTWSAGATKDCDVLTDTKGAMVNPHELPDVEAHEDIACSDCHSMHSGDDAQVTAPKACLNCHHTGAYECGSCHEVEQ